MQHIIAVGYSNGANIASSMLLLRSEILSAAILFRAMVPLVPGGIAKSYIQTYFHVLWTT